MADVRHLFMEKQTPGYRNESEDPFKYHIAPNFGVDEFINIGETNRYLHSFFHEQYKQSVNLKLERLLRHVALRNQDEAGLILEKFPHFIWRKAKLIEPFIQASGEKRVFQSISPLQYAAWAWDVPMLYWTLLHGAMFYAPSEEIIKIRDWRDVLREQEKHPWLTLALSELKDKMEDLLQYVSLDFVQSVINELDELDRDGTEHGLFYDPRPLIAFSLNYQRELDWKNIGKLQSASTLQVIHEYTRHDKCADLLEFNTDYLPRTDKLGHTDSVLKLLDQGQLFSIYRGQSYPAFKGPEYSSKGGVCTLDGDMVDGLFQVRMQQLIELKALLNKRLHELKNDVGLDAPLSRAVLG